MAWARRKLHPDMTVPAVVVAEQFHDLLRQGQRDLVLKLLAPDVSIFESG